MVKRLQNRNFDIDDVINAMLTKRGNQVSQKIEERWIVLRPSELLWYHNQKELQDGKPALGSI